MPKIADVKSKSKSRSKRRPLRDVSNGGFKPSISNPVTKKSNPDTQQQYPVTTCGGGGCEDPLDRLLLVHSDLSVLIRQIDELVVQALEQKVTNKKEIESFAHVLNEMQTSLKPWIPRFQKVLSTLVTESKIQVETNLESKKISPSINDDTRKNLDNPDPYNLDFLVSPSPLVSWRADCGQEGGRNLFMLTPLPKPSAFSSKLKKSSNPVKTNVKIEPFSPEKLVKRNNSIFVSTPHLKMSPPKSCILLEPASEYCNKNTKDTKPPTMGGGDSEPSSSQPSRHLGLKYPEIFGIKPSHELGNARKAVEASPNWGILSPPKTCVFLEPSDDQTVIKDVAKARNEGVIDNTPMCKDVDTTVVRGWRAGENTLKKELWMRFEAATGHEFRFKAKATSCGVDEEKSGDNVGGNKGFLDLLEEASCDDKNLVV